MTRAITGLITIEHRVPAELELSDDIRDWPQDIRDAIDREEEIALSRLNNPRVLTIDHCMHISTAAGVVDLYCERVIHFEIPPAPRALAAVTGHGPAEAASGDLRSEVVRDGIAGVPQAQFHHGFFIPEMKA